MSVQGPPDFGRLVERMVPLVAELFATLAARDPLRMRFADIANKTLLDMVGVLQSEGVSQEAVAASLGLTIGGFRARMRKLREVSDEMGARHGPRTLLERVFSEVAAKEDAGRPATYDALTTQFRGIKEDSLRGVLHFLVTSGLLSVSGRGRSKEYRVVVRRGARTSRYTDTVVTLYREGPLSLDVLCARLGLGPTEAKQHIERLRSAGFLDESTIEGELRYRATDYHVPLGGAEGFEAALYDHFGAVIRAITKKVRLGRLRASSNDLTGGSTFSFDLSPDDPLWEQVTSFLSEQRPRLDGWLSEARKLAAARPSGGAPRQKITIYIGQLVEDPVP